MSWYISNQSSQAEIYLYYAPIKMLPINGQLTNRFTAQINKASCFLKIISVISLYMGWLMGLEPTTTGITIRDSTNWATATIKWMLFNLGNEDISTIFLDGVPDRNRTCNPQLRRLVLFPIELRALSRIFLKTKAFEIGRGGEIRTPDILVPNQARYQTTLHPEKAVTIPSWTLNVNFFLLNIKMCLVTSCKVFIDILKFCQRLMWSNRIRYVIRSSSKEE